MLWIKAALPAHLSRVAQVSLFALMVLGHSASAAEVKTFTPAALEAAQVAGKRIVVDVTASWCSTCQAQKAIVHTLLQEPKFKDLLLLRLDYDSQKSAMRNLGVQERSTFVGFKGKTEIGRSTGETDKAAIERLFDKTS